MVFRRNRESRSREAAGRRNWPEAVPRKMKAEKDLKVGADLGRPLGAQRCRELLWTTTTAGHLAMGSERRTDTEEFLCQQINLGVHSSKTNQWSPDARWSEEHERSMLC